MPRSLILLFLVHYSAVWPFFAATEPFGSLIFARRFFYGFPVYFGSSALPLRSSLAVWPCYRGESPFRFRSQNPRRKRRVVIAEEAPQRYDHRGFAEQAKLDTDVVSSSRRFPNSKNATSEFG
jgi:hypothetical protein